MKGSCEKPFWGDFHVQRILLEYLHRVLSHLILRTIHRGVRTVTDVSSRLSDDSVEVHARPAGA
eukprot:1399608-Pleurochrysis_carterae.AAC.3